jgi:hypothetical protein
MFFEALQAGADGRLLLVESARGRPNAARANDGEEKLDQIPVKVPNKKPAVSRNMNWICHGRWTFSSKWIPRTGPRRAYAL